MKKKEQINQPHSFIAERDLANIGWCVMVLCKTWCRF